MHERGRLGLSDNCIASPAFLREGGNIWHQREALSIPGYLLAHEAFAKWRSSSLAFTLLDDSRIDWLRTEVVDNEEVL